MSVDPPTTAEYNIYTLSIAIFPIGCILIAIAQNYVFKCLKDQIPDLPTRILLYSVYISGCACGIVGLSLHAVTEPIWCEEIGLIPCFALLGVSKTFLWLFFLRRAKMAQGILLTPCWNIFFKYIGPIYLFAYWMIYCVLTAVLYAGAYVPRGGYSHCFFSKYALWFPSFAGFIDLFNALSSFSLFMYPLLKVIHHFQVQNNIVVDIQDRRVTAEIKKKSAEHFGFVSVMKWNISLSLIASASSALNLFMLSVAGHFIWLFCVGDPFVNALCTFFMISPNRAFIKKLCLKKGDGDQTRSVTATMSEKRTGGLHVVQRKSTCDIAIAGLNGNAGSPHPIVLKLENSNAVPQILLHQIAHENEQVETVIISKENGNEEHQNDQK